MNSKWIHSFFLEGDNNRAHIHRVGFLLMVGGSVGAAAVVALAVVTVASYSSVEDAALVV